VQRRLSAKLALLILMLSGCKSSQPTKASAPGGFAGALKPNPLVVALIGQEATNWCWAASAQMIAAYWGKKSPQCRQVQAEGHVSGCCNATDHAASPLPNGCDTTGWPDDTFSQDTLQFSIANSQLSWEQVKGEIDKGQPFAFSWLYNNGNQGHMMVAIGYVEAQTTAGPIRQIRYMNPLPISEGEPDQISYDLYVSQPGNYRHWKDYYGIHP
jgi:hypothetical protein